MDIEKIVRAEHLAYEGEDGEQKIYILPDAKAVEQLLSRLREGDVSDGSPITLSTEPQGAQESIPRSIVQSDVPIRQEIEFTTPTNNSMLQPMGTVEQLLRNYLAVDGEQKVYVLPNDLKVDEILGSLPGLRSGEVKQSQMWHKTDVTIDTVEQSKMIGEMNTYFQVMDTRMQRLELLLNQVTGQDPKMNTRENK